MFTLGQSKYIEIHLVDGKHISIEPDASIDDVQLENDTLVDDLVELLHVAPDYPVKISYTVVNDTITHYLRPKDIVRIRLVNS